MKAPSDAEDHDRYLFERLGLGRLRRRDRNDQRGNARNVTEPHR